jgi:hypothetical protein
MNRSSDKKACPTERSGNAMGYKMGHFKSRDVSVKIYHSKAL